MSSLAISKRLISSQEYHKMAETGLIRYDENVELINGEIYNMAPIGTRHFATVNKLTAFFVSSFMHQYIVSIQNSIHIDEWNKPEPDVAILKKDKEEYVNALPGPDDVLIIVEVSDTSYDEGVRMDETDKEIKLPIYASAGIPVYLIVNLPADRIEVYSDPTIDEYKNRTIYYSDDQIFLLDKEFDVSEILLLS